MPDVISIAARTACGGQRKGMGEAMQRNLRTRQGEPAFHRSPLASGPLTTLMLALALLPTLVSLAHADAGKPSRAAVEGCTWEKLSDSSVGLDAWVQRCDFGFRKIDYVLAGHALAERWDGGKPEPLVEVLELKSGETEQAGLTRLFGERTDKALAAKCVLKPYTDYKAPPRGIKRYTFVPDEAYQKQIDAGPSPDGIGDPACGDWGDAPDGIQYFEVQPASKAARRVLFVRVGQDEPLFDEQTLRILPAK
jgi:hypothetical protein